VVLNLLLPVIQLAGDEVGLGGAIAHRHGG
jgi:hypothetical protein